MQKTKIKRKRETEVEEPTPVDKTAEAEAIKAKADAAQAEIDAVLETLGEDDEFGVSEARDAYLAQLRGEIRRPDPVSSVIDDVLLLVGCGGC